MMSKSIITKNQENALREKISQANLREKLMLELILYAGSNFEELSSIKLSDININDAQYISVTIKLSKRDKYKALEYKTLPLGEELKKLMQEYISKERKNEDNLLIPLVKSSWKNFWKSINKVDGESISIHDIIYTTGYKIARESHDLTLVQYWLGYQYAKDAEKIFKENDITIVPEKEKLIAGMHIMSKYSVAQMEAVQQKKLQTKSHLFSHNIQNVDDEYSRREMIKQGIKSGCIVYSMINGGVLKALGKDNPRKNIVSTYEIKKPLDAINSFRNAPTSQLIVNLYDFFPTIIAQGLKGLDVLKKDINELRKNDKETKINQHRVDSMPIMMAIHLLNQFPEKKEELTNEISTAFNSINSGILQIAAQTYGSYIKESYSRNNKIILTSNITDKIDLFLKKSENLEGLDAQIDMIVDFLLNARFVMNEQGENINHINNTLNIIKNNKSPNFYLAKNSIKGSERHSRKNVR
jgi:hypothetical protein